MRIDPGYSELHRLSDGTEVRLRLLRASDRGKFAAGFRRLSPESRYRRFFSLMPELSERMLRQLTLTDDWDHLAIIAERVAGDDATSLGVARYVRLRYTPDTAEASVAVIDEMQRKGLGRLLVTTLVEAARERGIHRFRASILAENEAGKLLLHSLEEHATARIEDGHANPARLLQLIAQLRPRPEGVRRRDQSQRRCCARHADDCLVEPERSGVGACPVRIDR